MDKLVAREFHIANRSAKILRVYVNYFLSSCKEMLVIEIFCVQRYQL